MLYQRKDFIHHLLPNYFIILFFCLFTFLIYKISKKQFQKTQFLLKSFYQGKFFFGKRKKEKIFIKDEIGHMHFNNITLLKKFKNILDFIQTNKDDICSALTFLHEKTLQLKKDNNRQIESLQNEIHALNSYHKKTKFNENILSQTNNEISDHYNLIIENQNEISEIKKLVEEILNISKKIESITDIIGEVVSQTNLLALNASVEAARAGTQGKGFAVVATEIRKLANETGESANYINELVINTTSIIENIYQKIQNSEKKSNQFVNKIEFIKDKNSNIHKTILNQVKEFLEIEQMLSHLHNGIININSIQDYFTSQIETLNKIISQEIKY